MASVRGRGRGVEGEGGEFSVFVFCALCFLDDGVIENGMGLLMGLVCRLPRGWRRRFWWRFEL